MSTAPKRGFHCDEFAMRTAKAQAAMARRGVGALLLTGEAEIRYFTGFMTQFLQSPTRPWFVLIPASGKPIAIIPTIGVPLMRDCYIGDLQSWASPAATDDGISLVLAAIRQHVDPAGHLGMMMGRETSIRMPLGDLFRLQAELGPIEFCDMTPDIQHIRMIKSPAEQAKLAHVCQLASDVFGDITTWVDIGLPLDSLFRQFKMRALKAGIDDVSYLVGAAGPGGYRDIIAPPTSKPLQASDVFMLDTGCVWDGYFSDFDRNFALHHANDAACLAHNRLYDAIEAALSILKPETIVKQSIRASDLFTAMDTILRPNDAKRDDAKGDDVGRYGHGLGIQLTEPPSHTQWDETLIEAGMVLTLEPSIIYADGLLMVAEENILIGTDGVTFLSKRAPRDLPIIKPA